VRDLVVLDAYDEARREAERGAVRERAAGRVLLDEARRRDLAAHVFVAKVADVGLHPSEDAEILLRRPFHGILRGPDHGVRRVARAHGVEIAVRDRGEETAREAEHRTIVHAPSHRSSALDVARADGRAVLAVDGTRVSA
jgi:hypothetical protein